MATVVYCRVSSDKQDSLSQRKQVEEYCERKNITVDRWIDVEISSRKSKKERGITKLTNSMKKGDTLIVPELSRLGRSTLELGTIVKDLIDKKIKLIAIKENLEINGKQDMGSKVMVTVFSLIAEIERDMISIRTKEGLKAAKARGVKLGNPDLERHNSTQKENAKEFAKRMERTIRGYQLQGMTQREIVDELNNTERTTRNGKRWHLSQLQRVIKNFES